MFIKLVVPALLLAAASASASASAAQTDSRTPAAKPAAAAGKANKICIKVAPMTGSRFEKVECKSRQDWARDGVDVDEMLK